MNSDLPSVQELDTDKDKFIVFTHSDLRDPNWSLFPNSHTMFESFLLDYLLSVGFRGCKFATTSRRHEAARKFYVYDPTDVFCMGWVGYGDYSIGREGDSKFAVYSPKISNGKYDDYRMQRRLKVTGNITTATRNANRYLLPISHEDVVAATFEDTLYTINKQAASNRSVIRTNLSELGLTHDGVREGQRTEVWKELCHLVDTHHAFLSSDVKDKVTKVREAIRIQDAIGTTCIDLYAVRVYVRREEVKYDVIRLTDVTSVVSISRIREYSGMVDKVHGTRTYRQETLPEEIEGKLSVLSICDVGDFVDTVGRRAMDTVYYVYA